jgi:hypothetical protein
MELMAATERPDLAELLEELAEHPAASAAGLRALIGDVAERAMAGRSRVERAEIVSKVLEALVTDVLDNDPRFYKRASFYGLTERQRDDELQRRRQEEAVAAAADGGAGEWHEPVVAMPARATAPLPHRLPRARPYRDDAA